ncbi:citrate lyase subunit beta / citryl-CoA lyase [Gordonia malaquae]|uniref:Putative citrate lyase beta chain n=1 Tax=Gordonia malaquae NBRC 108250 TaxID=1223542 RepID=M3THK5_GORML|nr:CoA ester lyase [Gordonia malaquae]GAC80981.1 putative citrate lyase beta chain [Gordonia malaquae NBRC 108250]SEE38335.1 citrate lyase subunit beta / citryl-CoA lyase [Gordonia malaquae]
MSAATASTLLFVPGDRPDRFDKAAAAGADLVVLDLEDAVSADAKDAARANVAAWAAHRPCAVRINSADTRWFRADLDALSAKDVTIMIPKAEDPAVLAGIGGNVIALIETARGVLNAPAIASVPGVVRLAVGTFDLAAELGVDPTDTEALLPTRGALVLASAAAGLPGPIDGVTAAIDEPDRIIADTTYARRLGFAGKLCIHPRQLRPAAAALRPTEAQIGWARRIVEASSGAVAQVDGEMVDKPVVDRAHAILARI